MNRAVLLLVTGFALIIASVQLHAEGDTEPVESLELRKIMREMGRNMQVITDAISREEWGLVEKTAPLVADHPQPPFMEKMRILSFIGTDVATFKGHDAKTHEAAVAVAEAAVQRDGEVVITAFATLQKTCLNCHRQFRAPFVEHFYGQE